MEGALFGVLCPPLAAVDTALGGPIAERFAELLLLLPLLRLVVLALERGVDIPSAVR